MITTKNEDDKSKVLAALKLAQKNTDEVFEVQVHDHEDDPGEEAGEYILWYMSGSHKKVRYFVGPPKKANHKPQWSYKKKDAAKLSHAAATITMERIQSMGYHTPMKIDKGGPDLTVIKGDFSKEEEKGPYADKSDAELEAKFLAQGGVKLEVSPGHLEKIMENTVEVVKADTEEEDADV